MLLPIEQLLEQIKSYTVAAAVANQSGSQDDFNYANGLLDQINTTRLNLALQSEMRQIFYDQINVPTVVSAQSVNNQWYSRNDRNFVLKRGIAALDDGVQVAFLNQGAKQRVITREAVHFAQLFSTPQIGNNQGQQIPFDFPEVLKFSANQAIDIAVTGQQSDVGQIILHGASVKDSYPSGLVAELQAEYLNPDGTTKYLPETQVVPLIFQWANNTAGKLATDPNGNENIFTVKNERSVLLTHVSTSQTAYRINQLTDEGRNQTIAQKVEVTGVAGYTDNPYTVYYELPYPHLLRAGDRLKGTFENGTLLLGGNEETVAGNVSTFLTFKGITL